MVLPEGVLPPKVALATPGGSAVTMQFRRGQVREGVVLDPGGRPAPNAEVYSQGVDGGASSQAVLTDAVGRFRVAVEPGVRQNFSAHIFRAPAEDWLGFAEGVPPGDEDVVIRLRPRGALMLGR